MSKTKCTYNWKGSGRQVFYDASTYETLLALYPCSFQDNFDGADIVIPDGDVAAQSGCKWAYKHVETGGSPTVAKSADVVNAIVAIDLDDTDEAQEAALFMNDQLTFSIAQGLIFEARVKLAALPGSDVTASWGLWGDYATASDYRVGFEATGGGAITCESDDNATDTAASSGVTALATDWKIYRIDCTTQSNIKFFIDGVRVASGTTFNNAASAANSKCQPHFGLVKASGTTEGTIHVDYVKIWQNRS